MESSLRLSPRVILGNTSGRYRPERTVVPFSIRFPTMSENCFRIRAIKLNATSLIKAPDSDGTTPPLLTNTGVLTQIRLPHLLQSNPFVTLRRAFNLSS